MPSLFDWSPTASSNTTIDGINTATGMSPANVDNVFRSMAALIRQSFTSALQNFLGGSAPLPIANGGTNATTSTGALANIGALSSNYQDLPIVNKSGSFTLSNSERGGGYNFGGTTTAAATISPNSSVPINTGAVFAIRNGGSVGASLTITRGAGVALYKNGSITSTDATIAVGGVATLIQWYPDIWTVSGTGVS